MKLNDYQLKNSSYPEYWEKSYQSNEMGWDIGGPTPRFLDWIQSQKLPLSICILGAGNGWDAIQFAEYGHQVTAVDFADSAIINMKAAASKSGVEINILHENIFNLDKQFNNYFDVVLEYTCYCAINPDHRVNYIRMVNHILQPAGKLVGLLFPIDKSSVEDGPPYGVELDETINLFSKYFTLVKKEKPTNSIERRIGREVFVIFKKNGQ